MESRAIVECLSFSPTRSLPKRQDWVKTKSPEQQSFFRSHRQRRWFTQNELQQLDIRISAKTVGRLLKEMGFSLRVNLKNLESGNKNPPPREVRNRQFKYINRKRKQFASAGNPVISVDAKKKEKVGNFKNPGASWQEAPYVVNDHDFPSDAVGMAIPYGIYDTEANRGFVAIGTSHETPAFAVDSITDWWKRYGRITYPDSDELLILADCGGGNSARAHAWKYHLQHRLCDPHAQIKSHRVPLSTGRIKMESY